MAHFFEITEFTLNNQLSSVIPLAGNVLIVSNIHGNYNALQKVLQFALKN